VRLELLPFNEGDGNEILNQISAMKSQPPSAEAAAFNEFVSGRECIQGVSHLIFYNFYYM